MKTIYAHQTSFLEPIREKVISKIIFPILLLSLNLSKSFADEPANGFKIVEAIVLSNQSFLQEWKATTTVFKDTDRGAVVAAMWNAKIEDEKAKADGGDDKLLSIYKKNLEDNSDFFSKDQTQVKNVRLTYADQNKWELIEKSRNYFGRERILRYIPVNGGLLAKEYVDKNYVKLTDDRKNVILNNFHGLGSLSLPILLANVPPEKWDVSVLNDSMIRITTKYDTGRMVFFVDSHKNVVTGCEYLNPNGSLFFKSGLVTDVGKIFMDSTFFNSKGKKISSSRWELLETKPFEIKNLDFADLRPDGQVTGEIGGEIHKGMSTNDFIKH